MAFKLMHANLELKDAIDRVMVRPKIDGGYHVAIICTGHDPVDLVDPTKFQAFFHEVTDRKDIIFKDISSPVYWK